MCKNRETEATKQEELFFNLIQLSLSTAQIPALRSWRKGDKNYSPVQLTLVFPRQTARCLRVSPLKLVKSSRSATRGDGKMCSKSGLVFVSVRRIYFTLPKERRCCDSHCLGKKPGCKLSETLWRESQHTHARAARAPQQSSGVVCSVAFCVWTVWSRAGPPRSLCRLSGSMSGCSLLLEPPDRWRGPFSCSAVSDPATVTDYRVSASFNIRTTKKQPNHSPPGRQSAFSVSLVQTFSFKGEILHT